MSKIIYWFIVGMVVVASIVIMVTGLRRWINDSNEELERLRETAFKDDIRLLLSFVPIGAKEVPKDL